MARPLSEIDVGDTGAGNLDEGAPGAGDRNALTCDVCVVGAGPAGMAAALAASAQRADVVLADSGARPGGQFYRQPLAGPVHLPARFGALLADTRVRWRLGCEVWSASRHAGGFVVRLVEGDDIWAKALVLATGASELVLPFPGWELPGVITAGAAQALQKSQGIAPGGSVVVAGTGAFLLPVAAALAGAGCAVTLVEAATPARRALPAAAALAAHPAKAKEAASYAAALRGARVLTGRAVVRCEGVNAVESAVVAKLGPGWRRLENAETTIEADAVCVSYGFVPRLELARQLGAKETAGSVATGADMGTSVPGLFVAGELAGVAGAEVAELEGAVAGHNAASYALGSASTSSSALALRLKRARTFARRLEALYGIAPGWVSWLGPSTVFCRCEETTWGSIKSTVERGAATAREVRSSTRCGMGYCQGRTCGPALQLALASLTGAGPGDVGDLHKRPIAAPVAVGRVAGG
jgi:NADPH-dependent 2,4-dienoyl-CoA reductase/sulfur reductase-like enzyme